MNAGEDAKGACRVPKEQQLLKLQRIKKECQRCKQDDLFYFRLGLNVLNEQAIVVLKEGTDTRYIPPVMGLTDDHSIKFSVCCKCGQMQGEWPLPA